MANKVVGMVHEPVQWVNATDGKYGIVNSRFGSIIVGQVVDEETEKELFEVPTIVEKKGAMYFVFNLDDPKNPKIAFVKQKRPVVLDPDYLNEIWDNGIPDITDATIQSHMGVITIELPRGFTFGKDVLAEAEEETRFVVKKVDTIGNINSNSANYATSPQVIVAIATKEPTDRVQPSDEKIFEVVWLTREEIFEQVTLCCFSLGAITLLRAWCYKNPDMFWRNIGEKF